MQNIDFKDIETEFSIEGPMVGNLKEGNNAMNVILANVPAENLDNGRGNVFGIFADSRMNIEALRTRQQELTDASEIVINAAAGAGVDLTPDEVTQIEANADEAEKIGGQIRALERVAALTTGQGRRTAPDNGNNTGNNPNAGGNGDGGRRTVPANVRPDPRTGGFRNLGDFAHSVIGAANRNEGAVNRLMAMNEGVGEDGGFLVPPEFRDAIMKVVEGEDSLLARCDNSTTTSNTVTQNVDETTPWGTAGINVYWEGEAQAATASGMKFKQNTLRLNKLFGRVDVSDENLEDAPQLDNLLRVKAPEVMTSVINLAIVQGNGVGKPLGFMNSNALVTVAKETSQPADTIMHRNLVHMMGRMYARSWPRSVWLMHQDVWAQLPLLSFRDVGAYPTTAAVASLPIYIPPGGLSASPYGMLLGRPIMVLEAMETIGDLGDIALVDLSQYRAVTKTSGMRTETSIHLKFDTDETVFRFIFRLGGNPWWSAPISPRDGSNTRSCFVTLATR